MSVQKATGHPFSRLKEPANLAGYEEKEMPQSNREGSVGAGEL